MTTQPLAPTFPQHPMNKPEPCTYIVRFWMRNVGFGRQERDAGDAIQAATEIRDLVLAKYPDADVVVIGVVRK